MISFLEELKEILIANKDKRICVVGTTCTGKTTLLCNIPEGLDMDKIIFPLLTSKEKEYVCQEPWTEKIGDYMNNLVKKKINIKAGNPVFGTVIIDSDLIIFLDIDDDLLKKRTKLRNASFIDAKNMNNSIKADIKDSKTPCISIKVR